ncbi:MAG TPA: PKD domain-containing protein [Bacteroidetes bacterium]|nr:PKD domain-containing protein [Bacteroidota bacterium]
MKKFLSLSLFSLLSVFAFAQTADQTEGCAPLQVNFTAPAGSATFFWELGISGATSTDQNPSQGYADPGTYTVTFRETQGGPAIGTLTIKVYEKPEILITADPTSGCWPLDVAFTNNNTNIDPAIPVAGWLWDFGDQGTSDLEDPSHIFATEGSFSVALRLTSSLPTCNATELFSDFIITSDKPEVSFEANPPSSCTAPLTVNFDNTTPDTGLDFEWDFGNGTTFSGQTPPAVTYSNEGRFEVTLTGTNALGCSFIQTVLVTVGPPMSEIDMPDTVCINQPTVIGNNSSTGAYEWDFGAGASPQFSNLRNPEITFAQAGTTTVSLKVTVGVCESESSKVVFVQDLDPGFSVDPSFVCELPADIQLTANQSSGVTYQWKFPDNTNSAEQNPVFTLPETSLNPYDIVEDTSFYQFSLAVSSTACVFRDTFIVPSFEQTAKFEVDVVDGCAPLTVTFMDSSIVQTEVVDWEWHFGDGDVQNAGNADPLQHVYQTDGEYQSFLVITNALGCKDTSYFLPILVGTQLSPDFSVDKTEVCPGDTVHFASLIDDPRIDAWHFESDRGRTWHCFQEDQLDWSFVTEAGEPMDASLTVEYNGCFSTITKEDLIRVNGPVARIAYSMDCASPYDYVFADSSYDATSVTWDFGDSTQSNMPFVTHTYEDRDSFFVVLEAVNASSGCPASTDTALIYVREIKAAFELDTILCTTQSYMLNGGPSQDVDANCFRGYTWLFSDNRPITTEEASIDHNFSGPNDEQWLALEVTDINGCRDTLRLDVTVFELTADFADDVDRICFPADVNFTDLSSGDAPVVSWDWMFGDGDSIMLQNPSHTYGFVPDGPNGTLQVTLNITDSVGCMTAAQGEIEYYTPTSNISAVPPAICEGESINFFASDFTSEGSNLTWDSWDFGNGQTGVGQTGTATYPVAGNYDVTVNFTEVATGCMSSTTESVSVQAFPDAAFTSNLDNIDIICYPQIADFTSIMTDSITNWTWDFGNGQSSTDSTASTSFGKGTFEVTLTVATSNGCSDSFTNSYTLVGPEGNFDLSPPAICAGGEVTVSLRDTVDISSFEWTFGDGTSVSNMNPVSHTYDESISGSVPIVLIMVGEDPSCSLSATQFVSIAKPEAAFTTGNPNNSVCLGETFTFQNTSTFADTYEWDFGDGTTSTEENPEHTYTEPMTYSVTLTAINNAQGGCSDTVILPVTAFAAPQPMVNGTEVCNGKATELSIVGNMGSSFVWQPANLFANGANTGDMVTTVELTENTTISVTETTADGCVGEVSLDIVVVPDIQVQKDTFTACLGDPVTLTVPANELYNYRWTPAEQLSCTDCTETIYSPTATNTIFAFPEDIFGLKCAQDTFIFHVVVPENEIVVPNVFTPNGDSKNDFFNFVVDESIRENIIVSRFDVYNRFGQKVYSNENPTLGWDGQQNGKAAASDVYIYNMEVSLDGCLLGQFKGDVTLLR